jgi:DNA-binding CsgD family transcriptional regulator
VTLDRLCGGIVHLAHHAANNPELWDDVARELQRPLRARAVGFFEHNLITGQGDVPHSAGIRETFRSLYRSRFSSRNPWIKPLGRSAAGEALTAAALVPNWELVRTEFYRDWLRPQRVFHGLVGILFRSSEELGCVVALRRLNDPPFDIEGKRLLASVLPYLQCARQLSDEFSWQQHMTQMLLDLLAELPEVAIVLDGEARPIIMNRSAELLLARDDGLGMANGVISASSAQDTTSLRSTIAAAAGCDGRRLPPHEIVLGRRSGGEPLLVRIVSLSLPVLCLPGKRKGMAAILAQPIDSVRTDKHLCHYYGMTVAEARLADLIVVGSSLAGAAADLHITKNTARTHMKRIYAKTDTHRQSDLVRLLATRFTESRLPCTATGPSHPEIGAPQPARLADGHDRCGDGVGGGRIGGRETPFQ